MNTLSSAELQPDEFDFPGASYEQAAAHDPNSALRQQVAERLAAHRSRRRQTGPTLVPVPEPGAAKPARRKTNSIAAAVAERYAQSPSYRDILAAEAECAIEQANLAAQEAEAAAQVAARSAQAILFAQQELLEELENWNPPPIQQVSRTEFDRPETHPTHRNVLADHVFVDSVFTDQFFADPVVATRPPMPIAPRDLTVRLYEDIGTRQPLASALHRSDMATHSLQTLDDPTEAYDLDDEIEFRQSPVFEEAAGPPTAIPANLIEFPRQLVAARKARPRTAEGPLRDEAEVAASSAQLRIFEVEAAQISTAPTPAPEADAPVWSSILLDAPPIAHFVPEANPALAPLVIPPMQVAPLNLRLMAAIVDLCAVAVTFLVGVTAFALWTSVLPTGIPAAAAGFASFTVLFALYHLLFFTFSEATPGMRYARIGLCTFDDENPTRSQMRRRTLAVFFSALPIGLGFLWAWFDAESLGWHDRLSRMYQRHY